MIMYPVHRKVYRFVSLMNLNMKSVTDDEFQSLAVKEIFQKIILFPEGIFFLRSCIKVEFVRNTMLNLSETFTLT